MDPIRSPISATAPSLTAAVQALLLSQGVQPADVEALLQAVGQDLSVLFLGQTAEGAKLELPGGRVITAQGELPFPEGTLLRIRVDSEGGALKLQTLEARPPAAPALLAPLVQGEAAPFAARLQSPSPAPELEPLLQLLRTLSGTPESAPQGASSSTPLPAAAPSAEATRTVPPSAPLLEKAIAALPAPQAASLARALGSSGLAPEEVAARLLLLVEKARAAAREGLEMPLREGEAVVLRSSGLEALLAEFQGLLQRAEVPQEHRGALDGWLRNLLARQAPEPEGSPQAAPRSSREVREVPSPILTKAEVALARDAVEAHGGAAAEVPEAWETWVKGSLRALADPSVSPREAPFHALQAKEGTAYFEIPLPWAGGNPLQMWVEEDAPEQREPGREETRRVLLSLKLGRLGETRVGIQRSGKALSVRIWTERPGSVESQRAQIERELGEAGGAVDLRILPLNSATAPDLRSLAGGAGLHAMG